MLNIDLLWDILSFVTYAHTNIPFEFLIITFGWLTISYCNYTSSQYCTRFTFFVRFDVCFLFYLSCAVQQQQKYLLLLTDTRTTTAIINIVYSFSY